MRLYGNGNWKRKRSIEREAARIGLRFPFGSFDSLAFKFNTLSTYDDLHENAAFNLKIDIPNVKSE